MDRRRIVEASKGVGKPKIGGPFELVDERGEAFTERDLKGGFSIVSFFFSLFLIFWGFFSVLLKLFWWVE